ncbi:MAG: sialate O-acetylesterase [Granulosicoccus sp.]
MVPPVRFTAASWSLGLLLLLLLSPAGKANADVVSPGAPGDLVAVRYSATAGEVLWEPAQDNDFIVGYHVCRDGNDLGIKDARSFFITDLIPGQAYSFAVSAVDRSGNIGPELTVQLPAAKGSKQAQAGKSQSTSDARPSCGIMEGAMVLYSSHNRITLVEGDTEGFSIRLSLDRGDTANQETTLWLESDAPGEMSGLRHVFSSEKLLAGQSGSVLTMHLDVTQAPLIKHERYYHIVADDGRRQTRTPLVVDVSPTAAPDVYLLIGQSNMEGYSQKGSKDSSLGGMDERVARIWQLNVEPNNPLIFNSPAIFTDEIANIRSPMFVPAEDPLHEPRYIEVDGKGATFVGLGLTFAKEALRTTTADIYLVPAAWGATGFCANANGDLAWNAEPTDEPYLGGTFLADRALTRLNMTLRESGGVLRGILWHQGGADSNNPDCARRYAENLAKLVARLRSEARTDMRGAGARGEEADIPFMLATQSKGKDHRGDFSKYNSSKRVVDQAQRNVRDFIEFAGFVDNDDLVPPQFPCGQVSCVHFGADALREQGRRFYAVLKGIWREMDVYH